VKDKFPIPIVDELLGELKGGTLLHQAQPPHRLPPSVDAPRGHRQDDVLSAPCHFEFLVMAFGLTNASTFQVLMNDVLRAYLRQFVLVFFITL
jgi:hypothetical protein